jgi:hypothetical protein
MLGLIVLCQQHEPALPPKRFTTLLAYFYQLQVVTTSYSFSPKAATILRVTENPLGVEN